MAALLWLLIPVAGGVVASVWGGWAAKHKGTVPDAAGVAGYERFRAAMERDRAARTEQAASTERAAEDASAPAPRPVAGTVAGGPGPGPEGR